MQANPNPNALLPHSVNVTTAIDTTLTVYLHR